ncbi:MAG: GNAT family N-acetyltransferase [Chitinispirillia bacterium]|nr:GNAT family N-acetyltransferase [Chitinispirillia bacterium]MCL2269609.1 GNAT family N-acetyltransferase [Chitinispirillia bacterium]
MIFNYTNEHFKDVFDVIHRTIEETYPRYYPRSAVDFFHEHHSEEKMRAQMPGEVTLVLEADGKICGVGSVHGNEVKRFFILPEYQGRGYGRILLAELEKRVDYGKYDMLTLDASLGAVDFYRKSGFVYKDYKTISLPDGGYLCYVEMIKHINENYRINYDNRVFINVENTDNGEVDGETRFYYHQQKNIAWAEYYGGAVRRGFLVGMVEPNGELAFNYQHINTNNEARTGRCRSVPKILDDGRIELLEKWEWTSGDGSAGESVLVEVR